MQFAPENGIYTYFRYNDKETIMVVFNKNEEAIEHDISKYKEIIGNFTHATNVLEEKTLELKGKLTISGKKSIIFSFK